MVLKGNVVVLTFIKFVIRINFPSHLRIVAIIKLIVKSSCKSERIRHREHAILVKIHQIGAA